MPAPVELALATLLPTIAFLPPSLISLSNSLISQSRAKASSLKPEEEIGRTYACCHIACERLQKRLDLEFGKPAPPVKPKVYEKLYRYLDGVLTTPSTRKGPRTPQTTRVKDVEEKGSAAKSGGSAAAVGQRLEVKTPITGSKRTRGEGGKTEDYEDKEVPDFVMPMARAICEASGTPSAVPHVVVGATSAVREILSRGHGKMADDPPSRKRRTPQSTRSGASTTTEVSNRSIAAPNWPALLMALQLFSVAKMKGLDVENKEMKHFRKRGVDGVKAFLKDKGDELLRVLEIGLKKLDSNIDFYKLEAEDCGWLNMEWYQNIPAGEEAASTNGEEPGKDAVVEDGEVENDMPTHRKRPCRTPLQRKEKYGGKAPSDLNEDVGAAGLLPGLGTMFQPAVDWLSDARRRDYAQWKKAVILKISVIEANA